MNDTVGTRNVCSCDLSTAKCDTSARLLHQDLQTLQCGWGLRGLQICSHDLTTDDMILQNVSKVTPSKQSCFVDLQSCECSSESSIGWCEHCEWASTTQSRGQ